MIIGDEIMLFLILIEILILTPIGLIIIVDFFITKYEWCRGKKLEKKKVGE